MPDRLDLHQPGDCSVLKLDHRGNANLALLQLDKITDLDGRG